MTATLHPFPIRKASPHARGEGILNARRFNETTAELVLNIDLAAHLDNVLARAFPRRDNRERVSEAGF